ncbi:hypothetical protein H8S95_02500 [Pontibacter sp. KCTC 32443]|uniref:hypothetical protein n=1 Tax=Pontibacter TaxID=323449 RepID=UPI00164EAF10|nr:MULTISPECIES: hypothetical protein [Pontibacter]MBC5772919.1 hypothetical protein [Pontibacter sp. KCTC 32443]
MKRTYTSIVSLLLGSLFLYSCETCENPTITQISEADVAWLAYKENSRVNFENEVGDIAPYKFISAVAQNVPGEGYSLGDDCIEKLDSQASLTIQDTTRKHLNLSTYILRRPDSLTVRLAVQNRGDWPIDKDNPTYPSYDVNGHQYFNVFEVLPDSTKPNSVKQILFNKEFGFLHVSFYDGKSLTLKR